MAAVKTETKIAVLLSPHELGTKYRLLESLHVQKSNKGIDYDLFDLQSKELNKHYSHLPQVVRDLLQNFCPDAFNSFQYKVGKPFLDKKLTAPETALIINATRRHFHQLFDKLKPFFSLLKWYHRTRVDNGKSFKIAPCAFSSYRPHLNFHVAKESNSLVLKTEVVLNGASYNLNEFSRNHFLLESNSEYFLLSYKDYQTIEWIAENNKGQYGGDPTAFSQNILTKLELDYNVNRNNLFSKKEIKTLPVNRVLLSELNGAFLMLTPQWVYDGFVMENPWKESYETVVEGETVEIIRNKEAEDEFVKLLIGLHPNFSNQRNGYYYLSFAEAQKKQWFLKAYHNLLEQGIQLVGMDMLNHFRYSPFKVETVVNVKHEGQGKVLMQMKVLFGKEELRLNELQKMLLAGQKAVLLKDGSLGILHDEWIQQYSAIIKHGKINKDEIEVARVMAISEQQATGEKQVLKTLIKEQWWQKWQQWQNGSEDIYQLPTSVKATLRPYQQKGFEWLTLLAEAGAGGCLADDMGLGKTLQTICYLAYYIHHNPNSVNIIVCPSSLIFNWQQELQKFTPEITSVVYHGTSRNAEEVTNASCQVIITSYGTLRADAGTLLANNYGVAVIDESHNIKNPSAQITTVVNMIPADVRIALSGTPVVNNTFDLYAQLNFALPGMFGSREFFKREYADAIDRNHDVEKIKALQKLTAPFILRRTKEQVAKDLPDKTEMILWCKMNGRQQDLYNNIKDQIRGNIFLDIKNNGLNKSKLAVLQGMLKLRQICNSPLLLPVAEQESCTDSVKTEVLIGELKNILKEHKALVFSQFSSMLNLLAAECDKQGINYYHFDGQTPPTKRIEMVNAFQDKDNTTNLFLISLKAGNTGLTLTAADYVFLFDPWWNTAVEQQAIDRTHRIGQTKNVFAYKIICKDTIEEKIIQLQQRKKKLAEELVGEDDGFIKTLSEEDITYLFS
ncbi:DEAD/DEAH box helicase [Segetibacter sp.]|jgi:SNF2 family DNA or RNA helicase|uniref:DEAD/DEAH box helicase n=1 Tax=Segetibacter sp. TaxID=2231182 RepID=UPI00261F24F5|nr:DEAD/DEAH box helicase [Segetibacter sp.]MCW3082323.1 helicase [Segetibacter sp.]